VFLPVKKKNSVFKLQQFQSKTLPASVTKCTWN